MCVPSAAWWDSRTKVLLLSPELVPELELDTWVVKVVALHSY